MLLLLYVPDNTWKRSVRFDADLRQHDEPICYSFTYSKTLSRFLRFQ
jgi:hypothetical protein